MAKSYIREARKRVGPKRERIRPIVERLKAEHADAAIALRFRSPLELLVSVMLSAQTTDVNVNRVTERLFRKYHGPEDYLAVPPALFASTVKQLARSRMVVRASQRPEPFERIIVEKPIGRDLERLVLARAVRAHLEDRVLVDGELGENEHVGP